MPKLKLQYFGHLMKRADSLEKTPVLGKIEGRRRKGWQSMRWLDGSTDSKEVSFRSSWSLVWCSPRGHKELDTAEKLNSKECFIRTTVICSSNTDVLLPHPSYIYYGSTSLPISTLSIYTDHLLIYLFSVTPAFIFQETLFGFSINSCHPI